MLEISNSALAVTLLNPNADRDRLGVRYCAGGYVFQIDDAEHGPLLTGPTYPDSFNWFDGQGIPDSFNQAPIRSHGEPGVQALILGIGLCDTVDRKVLEFHDWRVRVEETDTVFSCRHQWEDIDVLLERNVRLDGRVVRSQTRVINQSMRHIPVTWFPHPFFPPPPGEEIAALSGPAVLTSGPFAVGSDGYIVRSDPDSLETTCVTAPATEPFSYFYRHPLLGIIGVRYSFAARHSYVWGNARTCSIEPFLDATVGHSGCVLEFGAEYHF